MVASAYGAVSPKAMRQRTLDPFILVLRQRRISLWLRIQMYYIYVLKSMRYGTRYIGSAENINKRLIDHNLGRVRYTKGRLPWKLIYQEHFFSRGEAMRREGFLKSGQGRKFLDEILKTD